MSNILIAKAVAALETSVGSILGCDESDATKREALAETFSQFEDYMRNSGGTDVAKARDRGAGGHRSLTGALIEHLHDRLERRREQHGYQKSAKETSPMTVLEDIAKSHGVRGVVQIAKNITEEQRSFRITEEEFVKLIDTAARVAHPELGARAFEKVYERDPIFARAIAVIKDGLVEQLLSGGLPVQQVVGEDTRDLSDTSTAIAQLKQLGARKWPTASAADQFERALTDPANHKLARVAVPIPRATTFFPMPR